MFCSVVWAFQLMTTTFSNVKRMSVGFGVFACSLLGLLPVKGWADDMEHELQNWNMVTLRVDAPHRLSLYVEGQSRTGLGLEKNEGMDRLLVRGALGYRVTPWMSLWQGYAWTPSYRPQFQNENRLFQQLLLENKVKKLTVINRTRLEERFIEDAGATSMRFRHMLRLSYPLDKAQKWSAVAYDEYFVNLNRTPAGPRGGFDQNRIFVGLNRRLSKQVNAEAGYMFAHVNRHGGTPDKSNHIILLTLNMIVK
jgi:Protein of unknown function (DUF2490)